MRALFKIVPRLGGRYAVSRSGRIRSLDWVDPIGRLFRGKELSPFTTAKGYRKIHLRVDGKVRVETISRLVLEAFVGPAPDGHAAAHRNGKPGDDRLSNLRWATYAENEADKKAHGTYHIRGRNYAGYSEVRV